MVSGQRGRVGANVTSPAEVDLGHARVHVTTPLRRMGVRTVQARITSQTPAILIRVQVEYDWMDNSTTVNHYHL